MLERNKQNKLQESLGWYLEENDSSMIVYIDGLSDGEKTIKVSDLDKNYTIDSFDEESDTLYLTTKHDRWI